MRDSEQVVQKRREIIEWVDQHMAVRVGPVWALSYYDEREELEHMLTEYADRAVGALGGEA